MSSHHIIRDEQEPALLILSSDKVDRTILDDLLAWSPSVIVLEKCFETVASWGIKIDIVLGSSKKRFEEDRMNFSYLETDDIYGDIWKTSKLKKYTALNIIGEFNKDCKFANENLVNLVWYEQKTRFVLNRQEKFEKWIIKGDRLKIYADAFNYKEMKLIERNSEYSELQAVKDGIVQLHSETSPFWISENI